MKNKGFTTLELIVSFSLTMIVMIFLFQIILILKDLYIQSGIKSQLLVKKSLIEDKIGEQLTFKKINIINKCGENCINIIYEDNTSAVLKIDYDNGIFKYGDYSIKLIEGAYFGTIDIDTETLVGVSNNQNNSIFKLHIPIYHKLLKKDYGAHIIYQYDSRTSSITDFTFSNEDDSNTLYLKGLAKDFVYYNTEYDDPGYYVLDSNKNIIENAVVIVEKSSLNIESNSYTITYRLMDESNTKLLSIKKRTITYINKEYSFDYTGSSQTFTVPVKGTYKIELWGAEGYGGSAKGGFVSGNIKLSNNVNLYVYVGQGLPTTANSTTFNGGTADNGGIPGGGATDVRLISGNWNDVASLRSRLIVAGGSGTSNVGSTAGYGGNLIGGSGGGTNGGTQVSAGARQSTSFADSGFGYANGGCAGGGGYYGGGGAGCSSGAGGGSSYISGYTGCVAITSESDQTPKSGCTTGTTDITCSYHYSGLIFTDTVMKSGNEAMPTHDGTNTMTGNSGNGYAKITLISVSQ